MIDIRQLFNFESLNNAWEVISSGKTARGIDNLSAGDFSKNYEENIKKLEFEITNGIYKPVPVKVIDDDRNISIVSIKDRLIQHILKEFLTPYVEKNAIDTNYGYIKGRSIYQAVDKINNYILLTGREWFYKCDIKGFFQSIDHEILLEKLMAITNNNEIVSLIESYLKNELISNNGKIKKPEKGIILGNPVSPVLSNIYLLSTDTEMSTKQDLYIRFSDDILVSLEEKNDVQPINIIKSSMKKVKLDINDDKSKIASVKEGFTYIGFDFKKQISASNTAFVADDSLTVHIKNKKFMHILKNINHYHLPEKISINKLENVILDDKKYWIAYLLISFQNDIDFTKDETKKIDFMISPACIEDIKSIVKEDHESTGLISSVVQYLINLGMYDLAMEFNVESSCEELESGNKPIDAMYINKYLEFFKGRNNAYARGYNEKGGQRGYYLINMELSYTEVESMINLRNSIGVLPLDKDNKTGFIVIDIDIDKRVIIESGDDGVTFNNMLERAKNYAFDIKNLLKENGNNSYVEFSGYKGYHIWIFFKKKENNREAISYLSSITKKIKEPKGINVEFIPSMEYSDNEIIKLPLSYHEITNRQAVFLNEEGKPFANQIEFIAGMIKNEGISLELNSENEENCEEYTDAAEKKDIGDFPNYITEVYDKCSIIKSIVDKSINDNYINHFERNALLYVFGHVSEEGREFLHFVISKCINYNFEVTEGFISRIKEKPVSCQKLKMRFQGYYDDKKCNCVFEEYPVFYASPVIFAFELEPEKVTRPDYVDRGIRIAEISKVNEKISMNKLVGRFIELVKSKKEIENELNRCKEEIENIFAKMGENEFETDCGKLIKKDNEWYLRMM